MFRAHIFKLIRSPYLYIGFIGVLAVVFYSMKGTYGADAYTNLQMLLDLESFRRMYVIFAAVPFAANFADEWNSKVITGCITRKNVLKYSVSNIVVCFISAFVTVFLGVMIYVFIILNSQPPFNTVNRVNEPYGELFYNGILFLPFFFMAFVFALSCGMWAVMGLAISAFFPSKYVAICSPFVFCYVVERCTRKLPVDFDLYALSRSGTDRSAVFFVPWACAVFLVITVICGIIFTLTVKRRVENELN